MDRLLVDLALALGLGLLVGFQRERATTELAGLRTFGLITLLGGIAAALGQALGAWVYAAFVLALTLTIGSTAQSRGSATTRIAAILMFGVGGIVIVGHAAVAVAVTGGVALLLHWKEPLHAWVRRLDDQEMRAVMRMVLIGLVILPALPDQSYGPYDVLNPFRIWAIVVLIVGISVAAYVAHRVAGPRVGALLAGVLGGLISSTATAASYARRSRSDPEHAASCALVVMLSSTVVFARMAGEIAVVSPALLWVVLPRLLVLTGLLAVFSALAWRFSRRAPLTQDGPDHLPTDLRAALVFGLLYAGVLFAVTAAQARLGAPGLYSVAILSGLTDVDAVTLSTAEIARRGELEPDLAWRVIVVASLSNLVFKSGVVAVLGSRALLIRVVPPIAVVVIAGAVMVAAWPAPS